MSPPCKITKTSVVELRGSHVIIDGVRRSSLKGCTFEPGARLIARYGEEDAPTQATAQAQAPAPALPQQVAAPTLPTLPTAPLQAQQQASTIQLPPEFADLQGLADLYSVSQTLGAPVAIALGAYMLIKGNKAPKRDKKESDTHACPRSPDLDLLTLRVEALEQRQRSVGRESSASVDVEALLKVIERQQDQRSRQEQEDEDALA